MTMTDERLAELDAVMAMLGKAPLWKTGQWFERNAADIRAHIDAQAATIARQAEAMNKAADQFGFYVTEHRAKGTPAAYAKAATNEQMRDMLLAALTGEA